MGGIRRANVRDGGAIETGKRNHWETHKKKNELLELIFPKDLTFLKVGCIFKKLMLPSNTFCPNKIQCHSSDAPS